MAPVVERRNNNDTGRREYDARPAWPSYIGALVTIAAVVWGAAVNVANATTTRETVAQLQTQVSQLQIVNAQLVSAVAVLNCKAGITCRVDGGH